MSYWLSSLHQAEALHSGLSSFPMLFTVIIARVYSLVHCMTLTHAAPKLCYDAMAFCVSVVYQKTGLVGM